MKLEPRLVHALGVRTLGSGPIKLYAMAVDPAGPRPHVVEAVLSTCARHPQSRDPQPAFILVHAARPAVFVSWHRWADDLDLDLGYYRAAHDTPGALSVVGGGRVGCVWELAVVAHERAAWWRHVAGADVPDHAGYLADVMNGWTDT